MAIVDVVLADGGVVTVDSGGGNEVEAEAYFPPGFEGVPMPGDTGLTMEVSSSGSPAIVGIVDEMSPTVDLLPGECRIYARNAAGQRTATIKLSSTGEVTIDASAVTVNAQITASDFIAAMIPYLQHYHTTPLGPSGPPLGGPAVPATPAEMGVALSPILAASPKFLTHIHNLTAITVGSPTTTPL